MAGSVEQICNQALMAAGITRRISDMYEGSEEAKIAIELYGQTRDELLRAADWSFSRRVAPLTLLKGPPPESGYSFATPWSNIYPVPGFLYEYAYPADCLDLRAILWQPLSLMPDLDPLPGEFRIDNDPLPTVSGNPPVASGPAAKVILCNITDAIAVYRAAITDPNTFEPGFVATLVARLAEKFAVALPRGKEANPSAEAVSAQKASATAAAASAIRG